MELMYTLKHRWTVVVAVAGLLTLTGMAMASAAEEDGDGASNDTVFNYAYDEESHFFFWNVTSLEDQEVDDQALFDALVETCSLDGVEYAYVENADGDIELTRLPDDSDGEEGGEAEVQCSDEFHGGDVTGPAGQVNHGMFLKLFNQVYDGPNRGCLVRHIAQSDLGKGDQQVIAGEDTDTEGDEAAEISGEVVFSTVETDCTHGNGDDGEESEEGNGPPEWVKEFLQSKDGPPGLSGKTPGKAGKGGPNR